MKERKVVDVRWFTGTTCVGVVKVDDPYEGIQYHIGAVLGRDEAKDIQHIADWGASFPADAGSVLFS